MPWPFTKPSPATTPLGGRSFWQRRGGATRVSDETTAAAGAPEKLPVRADFVVIGGGLAGLSTALALADAEPTAAIVVLEARFLGFGASGRNAGLLSPLPAPLWLASASGNADHLWGLAHVNTRVHDIARWLQAEAPDSGIAPKTLRLEAQGHITATGLARVAQVIAKAGLVHRAATSPGGHLAVDLDTHAVDPYRTVKALAALARRRGIAILENTPVQGVDETADAVRVAVADGREIFARAAVVCTNAYSGSLTLPQKPAAKVVYNFMVATEAGPPARLGRPGIENRFVVELNTSYVFYRVQDGRVIYGGIERFKPHGDSDFAVPPDVLTGLEQLLARSFPGAGVAPEEAWGGRYHQTANDLPILQRTGTRGAIVLNAGYGGTGVAMTLMCGRIAAALARGEKFADPDDKRLHETIAATRVPIVGGARFVAGVATDLMLLRRPALGS